MFAQGINVVVGTAIAILVVSGHEQLWQILVASMFVRMTQTIRVSARLAITYDLVVSERLLNPNATNFLDFSIIRAASPALGRLMVVAVGIVGAYFLMAALNLTPALVLLPTPKPKHQPRPTEPIRASIKEGLEEMGLAIS